MRPRLGLKKVTLRDLDDASLEKVVGGDDTYITCPTCCCQTCPQSCNGTCGDSCWGTCYDTCTCAGYHTCALFTTCTTPTC